MNKMIRLIFLITIHCSLFIVHLNAKAFTVASYNVENLFDLQDDGTEYKEYKPNIKYWNKKLLNIKLTNISKVINQLDVDIIALQEIESQNALKLLLEKLSFYKYSHFLKNPDSSVGLAVLSKFPIIKTNTIQIDKFDIYSRPILEVIFKIDNKKFKIYINHWRSKRAGENERIKYAIALKNYIFNLDEDDDYVLLGDFNSNYNEYQTFKYDKKLNNTYGITGINHILNTTIDEKPILSSNIMDYEKQIHFNLWLELKKQNRFSYKYRGDNNTPDNMLLPKALFDNDNISYIPESFKVFKPNYLYKNNKIKRWKKNKGYSDHLPILASFTTDFNSSKKQIKTYKLKSYKVSHLYNTEYLNDPIDLKDIVVIYKFKKHAVLKQIDGRAIYAYNCASELEIGKIYDLTVDTIVNHFGLLEIKQMSKVKEKKELYDYQSLYKDGANIDIFDTKYTNDIVTNLKGIYKKGYLHLENKQRIKLYFPKRFKKPKYYSRVTINSGHLGVYKSKVQILIHKKSDYKIKRR